MTLNQLILNHRQLKLSVSPIIFCYAFSQLQVNAENDQFDSFKWFTVAGNFDGHFAKTQFDATNHNAVVGQWDIRVTLEPPSWTNLLIFGPYIRFAGIAASKNPAWENGFLAAPGLGAEIYPFSWRPDDPHSPLFKILGPLRLYGEYNFQDYWGKENAWRPDHQIRAGAEYWLALYPNKTTHFWWTEIWAGGWYQSANEFDSRYNAWITAQSVHAGLRVPNAGLVSWITPYALVESSLTDHQSYYWENRLNLGGGLRIAPNLKNGCFINHFAIYAEYVREAAYYGNVAPADIPDHDWRAGVSFSVGRWFYSKVK
jgi:hypothetical protein